MAERGESHRKRWVFLIILFLIFIMFLAYVVAPSLKLPCPTVSDNFQQSFCH